MLSSLPSVTPVYPERKAERGGHRSFSWWTLVDRVVVRMAETGECDQCAARPSSLLRCSGCGQASYCDKVLLLLPPLLVCSQVCQKKGWKQHRATCRPYKVEPLPGKGLGMVAARRLVAGERLLLEAPVLVRSLSRREAEARPSLAQQFEALTQEVQAKVLRLHDENPTGSESEKVQRIFEANAIEVATVGCTALYPTIPR